MVFKQSASWKSPQPSFSGFGDSDCGGGNDLGECVGLHGKIRFSGPSGRGASCRSAKWSSLLGAQQQQSLSDLRDR